MAKTFYDIFGTLWFNMLFIYMISTTYINIANLEKIYIRIILYIIFLYLGLNVYSSWLYAVIVNPGYVNSDVII